MWRRGEPAAQTLELQVADLIAMWHAEHAGFARLLDVLDEQMTQFHDDGPVAFGVMQDIVSYLSEYADRFHHPREDAAFACLVLRDPTLSLPINRLLQEHRAIAWAGREFVNHLNEVTAGGIVDRARIEAAAALYLNYYRHHLATEERDILPRAASLLTAQDRRSVTSAVTPGPDPLFGPKPDERYRELRALLDDKALAPDAPAREGRVDAP